MNSPLSHQMRRFSWKVIATSLCLTFSPVILWFDLGLIAREGFSNVSYSKLELHEAHVPRANMTDNIND